MTRACPDPSMSDAAWEAFKDDERHESPVEPEPNAWERFFDRIDAMRERRMLAELAERANGCVTVEEVQS